MWMEPPNKHSLKTLGWQGQQRTSSPASMGLAGHTVNSSQLPEARVRVKASAFWFCVNLSSAHPMTPGTPLAYTRGHSDHGGARFSVTETQSGWAWGKREEVAQGCLVQMFRLCTAQGYLVCEDS